MHLEGTVYCIVLDLEIICFVRNRAGCSTLGIMRYSYHVEFNTEQTKETAYSTRSVNDLALTDVCISNSSS